ncbi:MAG: chemotaxis protein CheW [Deltaproteobacteria bacterium]
MNSESSLMLFSVREFVFAMEIGSLLEVAQISSEKLSPDEAGPFRYRFNFRGKDIPVLDLAERSGIIPTPIEGLLQLLVVEMNSNPFALLIDKVLEVAKEEGVVYRFPAMLRSERNEYIKAIYRLNDRISFFIEPGSLLKDEGIAELRTS